MGGSVTSFHVTLASSNLTEVCGLPSGMYSAPLVYFPSYLKDLVFLDIHVVDMRKILFGKSMKMFKCDSFSSLFWFQGSQFSKVAIRWLICSTPTLFIIFEFALMVTLELLGHSILCEALHIVQLRCKKHSFQN